MDSFTEGMIYRIYCKDFLTYNSIECFPCAKLNMIVGPNGTGKSSLVNAIVLGLGGKTNIIGRAKQLSDYVKTGCKSAKIEIELCSEPANYTIGREFNTENKSSWTINGQHVAYREVEKKIKEMNIQVDNLCQFLPQDRVQDFAKMDSKQLLENTLKTVGSKEIVNLHESLKQLREQETSLDSRTKVLRQNLESEKKKISRLENEVQTIKERQEMIKRVETLEKKKSWKQVSEKEERKKKIQEDRKKIMGIKKDAEERLAPFQQQVERTEGEIKKIDKELHKKINQFGDSISAGKRHLRAVETAEFRIAAIQDELNQKLESIRKRNEMIRSFQEEIRHLESTVQPEKEANLKQQVSRMLPLLAAKNDELLRLQGQTQETEQMIEETNRLKNRVQGLMEREMSAAKKKMVTLENRFPDTFQAYQWLQNNRDKFKKHIYGPIMLEINCNEETAKFVEFVIPHREMIMFVCEDKDDMNKLLKSVRDGASGRQGLRINVATVSNNYDRPPKENYSPKFRLQDITKYGFWDYAINQINGPNAVLNYLCHNFGLHQIPLGNAQVNSKIDQIPKDIRYYFSDTQQFSVRYSKYSGERATRMVDVTPSVLLAGSSNTQAIASYKKRILEEEQKLKEMRTKSDGIKSVLSNIERELNGMRQKKKDVDQELMNSKRGRSKLNFAKDQLKTYIQQESVDPEEEQAKADAEIKNIYNGLYSEPKNMVKPMKEIQNCILMTQQIRCKQTMYQRLLKVQRNNSLEASKKVDDANRMLVNVEQELREATRTWERMKAKALEMTDGLNPGDSRFQRKYEEVFSGLPEDIESLDREISDTTARVDCMSGGRESALEEYNKTKKAIAELERAVANPEQQLASLKFNMHSKRDQWLPQVQCLIDRININFTNFFCLINCVGEVSLEIPEEEDEYGQYGICIRVQFRESSRLQKLGPHTQSGGERAVATAIYMLSLQELTTVPFRCVDEINQGMDENNERVVFRLMVNTVEKVNSAQCFLLTPKVLPNLEYSENVRVLCIYSGPGSISHLSFKVNQYLENVRKRSDRLKRESLKRKKVESDDSE